MSTDFSPERRRLTSLRLAALGIDRPSARSPEDAVRALLAMQAQDFPGTVWAIGLRTPTATATEVESAHAAGRFVRSWPMRGTLHVIAPEDLHWMLSLTAERMIRTAEGRRRQLAITDRDNDRAESIARELLAGGNRATRRSLLDAFDAGGVSTEGQRGAHLLVRLAQSGVLVLAERDAWVLLDEWVTAPRHLERDEALGEFAERFFRSHGPATVRDFSWWSSLTLSDARAGVALARDRLAELVVDGTSYFLDPHREPAGDDVHLLPGFDEYLLGYTDRSAPLAGAQSDLIVPGGNGMFLSTVVVDGEVVGSWKRNRSRDRVVVTLLPFRPLTGAALGGVRAKLARYGEFLNVEVVLDE